MLKDTDVIATIAVKSLDRAKKFYGETLGLHAEPGSEPTVITYRSGRASLMVYESQFAGTNQATGATWAVDDVDAEVKALKAKGVVFEHYDDLGLQVQGDVHVQGNFKVAWLKDLTATSCRS
ncbi:MAG TPA: VOC family protein [Thermoanaerobaculia bacterium]|nr:VOC family protein [Thermoanaerobaculia bacterium]